MKIIYLLFLFIFFSSCGESQPEQEYYVVEKYRSDSLKVKNTNKKIPKAGYKIYTNPSYHVSLEYPKDWNVYEMTNEGSLPVINLFSVQDTYSHRFPVFINANPQLTHVSFYPEGIGVENPLGISKPIEGYIKDLPISFSINEKDSKVYLLENLQVYGYYIKPSSPPPGWNKDGFIYVQVAVDGFYFNCFDLNSGIEKPLTDCEPAKGDKVRKYGNINEHSRRVISDILSSVYFYEDIEDSLPIADLIKVSSPKPYQEIIKSLTVGGEAIKSWYNKSHFPVILTDRDYQVLARGNAMSTQKNPKEDFIPFEVTLDFKNPVHDKGFLILKRANPSKKPEQDRSIIIPVTFPIIVR